MIFEFQFLYLQLLISFLFMCEFMWSESKEKKQKQKSEANGIIIIKAFDNTKNHHIIVFDFPFDTSFGSNFIRISLILLIRQVVFLL